MDGGGGELGVDTVWHRGIVFTVPEQQQAEPVQIISAPGEQVAVLPSLTEEMDTPIATAVQVEPSISASVLVESSPSAAKPVEELLPSPGEWCREMLPR